jgi:hypothetical protein
MTAALPHENCYWVQPGRLLAGEYPSGPSEEMALQKLDRLLDHGIDCFIDLTHPGELLPYEPVLRELATARGLPVDYLRIPIRDFGVPDEPSQMVAILDALDAALAAGRRPYVHCWGGVGRTGTVVGCHVARHGFPGDAALARLAELWPQMASRGSARAPPRRRSSGSTSAPGANRPRSRCRTRGRPRDQRHGGPGGIGSTSACLLGGAVGDALGAPVEFLSLAQIRSHFGSAGIRDFAEAYGRVGAITDDTQMTLFTAEGLLRATVRGHERGGCHPPPSFTTPISAGCGRRGSPRAPSFPRPGRAGGRTDGWFGSGHYARAAHRGIPASPRSARASPAVPTGPSTTARGAGA